MVPKKRGKLHLNAQTIRNLTPTELGAVGGGLYTVSNYCATAADTTCCATGGECNATHALCAATTNGKAC